MTVSSGLQTCSKGHIDEVNNTKPESIEKIVADIGKVLRPSKRKISEDNVSSDSSNCKCTKCTK